LNWICFLLPIRANKCHKLLSSNILRRFAPPANWLHSTSLSTSLFLQIRIIISISKLLNGINSYLALRHSVYIINSVCIQIVQIGFVWLCFSADKNHDILPYTFISQIFTCILTLSKLALFYQLTILIRHTIFTSVLDVGHSILDIHCTVIFILNS